MGGAACFGHFQVNLATRNVEMSIDFRGFSPMLDDISWVFMPLAITCKMPSAWLVQDGRLIDVKDVGHVLEDLF